MLRSGKLGLYRQAFKEAIGELAAERAMAKVSDIMVLTSQRLDEVKLSTEQLRRLTDAVTAGDVETAVHSISNEIQGDVVRKVLKPLVGDIYKMRLLSYFLDSNSYATYVMKMAALYGSLDHMGGQITSMMVAEALGDIKEANAEAEAAHQEYHVQGKVIDE